MYWGTGKGTTACGLVGKVALMVLYASNSSEENSEGFRKGRLRPLLHGGLLQHSQILASFFYSVHTLWGEKERSCSHGRESGDGPSVPA